MSEDIQDNVGGHSSFADRFLNLAADICYSRLIGYKVLLKIMLSQQVVSQSSK